MSLNKTLLDSDAKAPIEISSSVVMEYDLVELIEMFFTVDNSFDAYINDSLSVNFFTTKGLLTFNLFSSTNYWTCTMNDERTMSPFNLHNHSEK